MKIILDADMLLFRAAAATEVEVQLDEDVWTRHSEMPQARQMYWDQVTLWCDQYGVTLDDVLHCFTDASAFRRELFPGYKLNRKGTPKPIGYKQLRAEVLTESNAFMFHKIEADDLIGIFATMLRDPAEYVIASGDKDMLQIPGTHIWLHTGKEPEPEEGLTISYVNDSIIKVNTNDHAERFTYQQYLSGDATDGVPGCPSIGDKRAADIVARFNLSEPVDCWQEIVRTYETKGKVEHPSAFATQQARLVRILRDGEYDFENHAVTLWNPPTP